MKPTLVFLRSAAVFVAAASCGTVVVTSSPTTTMPGTGAAASTGGGPTSSGGSAGAGSCIAPWSEAFTATDSAEAYQVAIGPGGDLYVMGGAYGAVDLGMGPLGPPNGGGKIFLAKLDCAGKLRWGKVYEADPSMPYKLSPGVSGEVYLTGSAAVSIDFGCGPVGAGPFVARIDGFTGACAWSKSFGGVMNSGDHVAADVNGVVVTGTLVEPVDVGAGPVAPPPGGLGAFVVRLDKAGGLVWSKVLEAQDVAVAINLDGEVLACGQALSGFDLGGGPLPAGDSLFVGALDAAGNQVWVNGYVSSGGGACDAIAVESLGRFVIAGRYNLDLDLGGALPPVTSNGDIAVFVAAFEPGGKLLFGLGSGAGNGSSVRPTSAVIDVVGNVYVAGWFQNQLALGGATVTSLDATLGAFALNIAPGGSVQWARGFGTTTLPGGAAAMGLALAPFGAPILAGWFKGSVGFGAGPTFASPIGGGFVAQLAP